MVFRTVITAAHTFPTDGRRVQITGYRKKVFESLNVNWKGFLFVSDDTAPEDYFICSLCVALFLNFLASYLFIFSFSHIYSSLPSSPIFFSRLFFLLYLPPHFCAFKFTSPLSFSSFYNNISIYFSLYCTTITIITTTPTTQFPFKPLK